MSRSVNVARNVKFSVICQVIVLLMSFLCRTVFIQQLGVEYLGVSGLFTNILTVLSFAEMGIGDAIIYSMYKPIAQNDTEKLKSLMKFFKKAYTIIGITVFSLGICILPFLKYLISGDVNIKENISCIYLLFLLNVSISYFFVYKQSLINAYQKSYIVILYQTVVTVCMNIIQIIVLLISKNYILYLVIQIVCTIAINILLSVKADKEFQYIKERNAESITVSEKVEIFKNIRALFVYKIGSVTLNGTDNILISMLLGLTDVGVASNYQLLLNSIETILNKVKSSFIASVGNLNVTEGAQQQYYVFKKMFMIIAWLYGLCSIGIMLHANSLIKLWIGQSYSVSSLTLFALTLNFYVTGVHSVSFTYRTTLGLFRQGQFAPVVATVVNIVLSVILAKQMGLAGIFLATPISRILGMGIFDPVLIYKSFKKNPLKYYVMYIAYAACFLAIYFIIYYIMSHMQCKTIMDFILQVLITTVIYNALMVLIFGQSKMFKEVLSAVWNYIRSKMFNDYR